MWCEALCGRVAQAQLALKVVCLVYFPTVMGIILANAYELSMRKVCAARPQCEKKLSGGFAPTTLSRKLHLW